MSSKSPDPSALSPALISTLPSALYAQLYDPWYCSPNMSTFFLSALFFVLCAVISLLIYFLWAVRHVRKITSSSSPETAPSAGFFVSSRCNRCSRTREHVRALQGTLPALADMARTMQVTVMHEGTATRHTLRALEARMSDTDFDGAGTGTHLAVDRDLSDALSIASETPSTTPTVCDRPGSPRAPYPFPDIPPSVLVSPHALFVPPHAVVRTDEYASTLAQAAIEIAVYAATCEERRERAVADLSVLVARIEAAACAIRDVDASYHP